jgi:hypothetical protein
MQGAPKNTIILHWEQCQSEWAELPWPDWLQFRELIEGGSLIAGAQPGEHYFLICMLENAGGLTDAIPHRYAVSAGGRLAHGFDGLTDSERSEYQRIKALRWPTVEDTKLYNELGARALVVNLPPVHTLQPLLRALPGLVGAHPRAPCWHFLSAIGICRPSTRAN